MLSDALNPVLSGPGPVPAAPAAAARFVAYYQVSTERQGRSGLGLDTQREAVARHVAGCAGAVLAAFEEVESGKRADRPAPAAPRC